MIGNGTGLPPASMPFPLIDALRTALYPPAVKSRFPPLQAHPSAYVAITMTAPNALLAIAGIGTTELIVILVIVLIFFGGSKLPSLAKGLGQSIKEFKTASKDEPEAEKPAADVKKPDPTKTHGAN